MEKEEKEEKEENEKEGGKWKVGLQLKEGQKLSPMLLNILESASVRNTSTNPLCPPKPKIKLWTLYIQLCGEGRHCKPKQPTPKKKVRGLWGSIFEHCQFVGF